MNQTQFLQRGQVLSSAQFSINTCEEKYMLSCSVKGVSRDESQRLIIY